MTKPLYSPSREHKGLLVTSGQLPIDPKTGVFPEGIEAQTKVALENNLRLLEEAGYSKSDILKVNIYFTSLDQFDAINTVYREFMDDLDVMPARLAVAVAALPQNALVEIEMLAMK